jgi:outer membrane murein-binding lipoprotein Lpp
MVVQAPRQQTKSVTPPMNIKVSSFAVLFVVSSFLLAGCSTTDSRIKNNQASFDAAPPAVQAKIRAGKIEVGFTAEQVIMALGKPDRRYTRTTERGTSDIWAYEDHGPSFSFGVGVASGGGGSMVGTGMAVHTGNDRYEDKMRVVIESGRVTAIETRGR